MTGSFAILTAIFLWSSLGVVVRKAGVPVHVVMFYSCLVSVALQAILLKTRLRKKPMPRGREILYPLALGFFSLLNMFSFYYAFQNTTIANAVLTHYIAPVIVAFCAPAILKETISKKVVWAILMASIGLWVMLRGFSLDAGHGAGIAAGIFSGFTYAAIVILARVSARNYEPLVLAFFSNGLIAAALLPFVREFPLHAIWSFLLMGIVHSTAATMLYYHGLKTVTANRAAVLGYLEPVSAIIFSVIFLGESVGMNTLIGGMLVILSGYLTLTGDAT